MTMTQETFIQVGNSKDPWTVVASMREWADLHGSDSLKAEVTQVPQSTAWDNILTEWEHLEWAFHHHGPKGYRFVTAENDYPRFGFELIIRDH